ncbi:MAG: S41 family peptidase [Gammaproteobacteria bacterium]|nr:S41 family peptidase [Gammaproteobacteria bacterium]
MFKITLALLFLGLLLCAGSVISGTDSELRQQRQQQIDIIEQISQQMLPNPAWLETAAWRSFLAELRSEAMLSLPLEQFVRHFNRRADALPFTHFHLLPRKPSGKVEAASSSAAQPLAAEPELTFTQPAAGVGVLRVARFDLDPQLVSAQLAEIHQQNLSALIIDLRGNTGGSFPSVVALSRYLRSESLNAGYFLTRRWFMQHGDYPDQAQRQNIAALQTLDLQAFADMLQRDGALQLELPAHNDPVFNGKLLILTDGDTGSAAEPFVYLLQQQGVTIVGEVTDGAMLSGDRVPVDDDLLLFLPVADYVAPDGTRLDLVGVQPDVAVPGEQALATALQLLARD